MPRSLIWLFRVSALLILLLTGPAFMAACSSHQASGSWRTADRSSAGLAPLASETPEAVVQVYGARAYRWRGYFAEHTWIATKEAGSDSYLVNEVTGWGGANKVRSYNSDPDRAWYGAAPRLYADLRGEQAEQAIVNIRQAVARYPYQTEYEAWPGPNSNTFVAWVIREVPELDVVLPNTAIGKDYLGSRYAARSPSGSGYQLSANGYIGILAGIEDGIEINVLGLSFGLDPLHLGVKIPGIGQLSLRDPWPGTEASAD